MSIREFLKGTKKYVKKIDCFFEDNGTTTVTDNKEFCGYISKTTAKEWFQFETDDKIIWFLDKHKNAKRMKIRIEVWE